MVTRELVLLDSGPWNSHSESYTARLTYLLSELGVDVTLIADEDFLTTAKQHIVLLRRRGLPDLSFVEACLAGRPLVDMDYARTLRVRPSLRSSGHVVRILHGIGLVRLIGDADRLRFRSIVRTTVYRRMMRADLHSFQRIIVHTKEAHEYLGRLRVRTAYVPLPAMLGVVDLSRGPDTRDIVLFVGGYRDEKGGPLGLESLRCVCEADSLTIVITGDQSRPPPPEFEDRVVWPGRVSSEELENLYRRARFVMLPYPRDYEMAGAASLVLQEALAHGAAVVATPWAREQAVSPALFVADGYDHESVAVAIRQCLASPPVPPLQTDFSSHSITYARELMRLTGIE